MTRALRLALALALAGPRISAQDSDPVARWAAIAAHEIRVFPDGEKDHLAGPGIVYNRAGNVDLKLDVFTPVLKLLFAPR